MSGTINKSKSTKPRRLSRIRAKPGELAAAWGKPNDGDGPDICWRMLLLI
jgi:hypothetical protein